MEITNLMKRRWEANLTVKKLSMLSGVSEQTIFKYEQMQRDINKASIDILLRLSEVLEVPIFYILEGEAAKRMRAVEDKRRRL